MDSRLLNKESCEEVEGQTKTFYLDCDAELEDDNLGSRKVLYDVDFETLKETGVGKPSEDSERKRSLPKCFNCDGDHFINNCKVERNVKRIAESRKRFIINNPIQKTGKKVFSGRYHRFNMPNEETMKVGSLSDEIRASMGLRWNELPVHIYNMRKFGYPPGWEESAIEKINVLKIYDSAASSSTHSTQPEKTMINPDLIHIYPGFNSPVVYPFYDDYNYWRVPPYSDRYSRENYIRQLQNRLNSEKETYSSVETITSAASNDIPGEKEASKDHSKYHHETSDQNFIYERRSGLQYSTRESDPYLHYTGVYTNEHQHAFLHENTTKRRGQKDHLKRCRGKPVRTTEFSHRDSYGDFRRGKRYNPYSNQPMERTSKPGLGDIENYFPDDENLKCVNDDSITDIGGKQSNATESEDEEVLVITETNTLCDEDLKTDRKCEKATTNTNCKDEVEVQQDENITNPTSKDDDEDVVVTAYVDYSKKPLKSRSPENIINLSYCELQRCIQVLKANFEKTDYEYGDQLRYGELPSLSKFSIGITQLPLEPPREESGRLKSVIDKIRARNKR